MQNRSSAEQPATRSVIDKGLKRNAISFLSNVVIGISSTAPAYSLASALGGIAGFAGVGAPAVLLVAFVPMLCIAVAYHHLNRVDPDCGTTFSWTTRAMGPHAGWIGGWAIIATDIIVMPSLAAIAGQYSLQFFGIEQPSVGAITLVGTAWIALMTIICYLGIELSALTQRLLLGAEFLILMIFAVAALTQAYGASPPPGSQPVSLTWFNPFAAGQFSNFTQALLVAVFIYWGWDTGVSVNEETENSAHTPGRAAVVSTIALVGIFVLVAVAALAFAGPDLLAQHSADIFAPIGKAVLGPGFDKLLIVAVLTSASAATQTTILPTARTVLSMANAGALPRRFAEIDRRYLSPGFATVTMGVVSIIWYISLTFLSKNVLGDSILALGLGIAFYYGLTGLACVVLFRRELTKSMSNFIFAGLIPSAGALIMLLLFVESCIQLAKPGAGATVIFGVGGPLVIGLGALLIGVTLMFIAQAGLPDFFKRKPEVATIVPASPHAHDL